MHSMCRKAENVYAAEKERSKYNSFDYRTHKYLQMCVFFPSSLIRGSLTSQKVPKIFEFRILAHTLHRYHREQHFSTKQQQNSKQQLFRLHVKMRVIFINRQKKSSTHFSTFSSVHQHISQFSEFLCQWPRTHQTCETKVGVKSYCTLCVFRKYLPQF